MPLSNSILRYKREWAIWTRAGGLGRKRSSYRAFWRIFLSFVCVDHKSSSIKGLDVITQALSRALQWRIWVYTWGFEGFIVLSNSKPPKFIPDYIYIPSECVSDDIVRKWLYFVETIESTDYRCRSLYNGLDQLCVFRAP